MSIYTFSPFGYEGALVSVEVDLRKGIPAVDIVGLADGAVKESRERVIAAIRNSDLDFPMERVLISLSPADLKKEGSSMDLAIALEILARQDNLDTENILVMGGLELSGKLFPCRAIRAALATAESAGIKYAIIPKCEGIEIPHGIKVAQCESLFSAYDALCQLGSSHYFTENKTHADYERIVEFNEVNPDESLDRIEGLNGLKYAMAIAVAGRHHIMAVGKPGCGKTMILQRMNQLMPNLMPEERHSVHRIYSIAGLDSLTTSNRRPFRMPHQTASIEGICGGGPNCRAGEISLAHNGVLFLDEATEFRSSVLQMLRVPLETGTITLCRAGRTTMYPAKFQLAMAVNPCPCGNYGVKDRICLCSAKSIDLYWKKISAPLLDRIAIRYNCEDEDSLLFPYYTLEQLRNLVKVAYDRQYARQGKLNQDLEPSEIEEYITSKFSKSLTSWFTNQKIKNDWSPRAVSNIYKVARTIADTLDCAEENIYWDSCLKYAIKFYPNLPIDLA